MPQQETDMQKQRHRGNIAGLIINIVLIVAIIIAFFCTYTAYVTKNGSGVPDIFGYEPFSIQSDSMSPFFEKGDLVIDKRVEDTSKLEVGDVITFWTIIDGQKVLNTHRIIDIQDGDNFRYFVTKGDNNSVEDSLTVHESEIVGVYHKHIKKLGGVLDFLQTSKGFFCIIVLPVLAFFIYYFVSFFRVLMEYQGEKRRLLYEQELVASGRLEKVEEEPPVTKSNKTEQTGAEDEKPMREVFNRFLEKHQGKPQMQNAGQQSAGTASAGQTAQQQTSGQTTAAQSNAAGSQNVQQNAKETNPANTENDAINPANQANQTKQPNPAAANTANMAGAAAAGSVSQNPAQTATAQNVNTQAAASQEQLAKQLEEMQRQMELLRQQNEAAKQAAAQAAQLQQMQMQMEAVKQAQQQMQQNTTSEGITLSKEQLMALLGQANIQVPTGAQPAAHVAAPQPTQTPVQQESGDSISMSKSEFVDLISLAMKKAKEEE